MGRPHGRFEGMAVGKAATGRVFETLGLYPAPTTIKAAPGVIEAKKN